MVCGSRLRVFEILGQAVVAHATTGARILAGPLRKDTVCSARWQSCHKRCLCFFVGDLPACTLLHVCSRIETAPTRKLWVGTSLLHCLT